MGIKRGATLFEAVPALSARSSQTTGVLKLVPLLPDFPHLPLQEGRNLIGRDKEQVDHHIDAHQISRVHCEVNVSPDRITIHDLGSQNGTYVNGRTIQDFELSLGDELHISRSVAYRLVRDQALTSPQRLDFAVDESEPTVIVDNKALERATNDLYEIAPSSDGFADVTAHGHDGFAVLEQQRYMALILYQICLGCLMTDDQQERETLLSNVLPSLTELDAAFILHQSDQDWRASICPAGHEPSDSALKNSYKMARDHRAPLMLEDPRDLAVLGMRGGGALVVPMLMEDQLTGVIGVISHSHPFSLEALEAVTSFADICAAALRP